MHRWIVHRFSWGPWLMIGIAISWGQLTLEMATGQQQGFDFRQWESFEPDRLMDQFFGPPSEEEEKMLASIEISSTEERRFGQQLIDNYLALQEQLGVDVHTKGDEVDYLNGLVGKLQPQMKNARRYRRIRVYVTMTDEIGAYSFPGGSLVFTSGLIDFCESEAALLGVVGHELSHLDHGHQLVPLKRGKLTESTFRGGQGFSFDRMMGQMNVLSRAWTRPFRPEDELEADRDAAAWLLAIGYEPRELVRLMNQWQARNKGNQVNVPAFLRSHPYTEARVEAVEEVRSDYVRDHPDQEFEVGRETHRRRGRH